MDNAPIHMSATVFSEFDVVLLENGLHFPIKRCRFTNTNVAVLTFPCRMFSLFCRVSCIMTVVDHSPNQTSQSRILVQ